MTRVRLESDFKTTWARLYRWRVPVQTRLTTRHLNKKNVLVTRRTRFIKRQLGKIKCLWLSPHPTAPLPRGLYLQPLVH